jgi:hypothetical protein
MALPVVTVTSLPPKSIIENIIGDKSLKRLTRYIDCITFLCLINHSKPGGNFRQGKLEIVDLMQHLNNIFKV